MSIKQLLKEEINDVSKQLQTHLNTNKDVTFQWGEIAFWINGDRIIVGLIDKPEESYMFMTADATAEFVILNLVPAANKQNSK